MRCESVGCNFIFSSGHFLFTLSSEMDRELMTAEIVMSCKEKCIEMYLSCPLGPPAGSPPPSGNPPTARPSPAADPPRPPAGAPSEGVHPLPVRHQPDTRLRIRQQAVLQHHLLPAGRLLPSVSHAVYNEGNAQSVSTVGGLVSLVPLSL